MPTPLGIAVDVVSGCACFCLTIECLRKVLSRTMFRKACGCKEEKWPMDVWIDQYHEDAIDAKMEIIDPHHHVWDPRTQPKGWKISERMIQLLYFVHSPNKLTQAMKNSFRIQGLNNALNFFGQRQLPFWQPYMLEELLLDIRNRDSGKTCFNIVKTVYIECGWFPENVNTEQQPLGEARMAANLHKKNSNFCNAIVAHANLLLPNVEATLSALKKIPGVVGIRHILAWSPDEASNFGLHKKNKATFDPQFQAGFALLAKYGFSFDCWLYHVNLQELIHLATSFPNQIIICNHVGGPFGIGDYTRHETFPIWERDIRRLAAASRNVYCKLSGLSQCCSGFGFDLHDTPPTSDELAVAYGPYFKICLDAFGVKRCMFASNFPVDKVSCNYTILFNCFMKIVKDHSAADKRALFYENAKHVYKL